MLCIDHLHVHTLGLVMALSVLLKSILILSVEVYTAEFNNLNQRFPCQFKVLYF